MNWEQVKSMILNNINVYTDLNTKRSTYRKVNTIPKMSEYGSTFLKVRIGKSTFIKIELDELRLLFIEADTNQNGRYNKKTYKSTFPNKPIHHPCIIQVIGKIFEKSGAAKQINNRQYQFLNSLNQKS